MSATSLMVPEAGDYMALPAEREGRVLVRNAGRASNCCPTSAVTARRSCSMGAANANNIVCPCIAGPTTCRELLGAPHFDEQPCLNLGRSPLQNWRGLLFEGPRDVAADLARLGLEREFDFDGYMLDHVEVHECDYNWKTFIEVYLEDYHVEPFHPGLGKFVSCDDLRWDFGDWYSVQTVGTHNGWPSPARPSTSAGRSRC
jgi:choline monooxygenase